MFLELRHFQTGWSALLFFEFLLALLFISMVLRARKPAGATLGWIFIFIALPLIGIPLYIFLTDRKLGGSQKDPRLERTDLNRNFKLLTTGESIYQEMTGLIDGAKNSIFLSIYIFGNDLVAKEILNRLTVKARAGIEVKVIIDSFGAAFFNHPSFSEFKRAGGKYTYFMPLLHLPFRGRSNLRNHRKILVIDHETAMMGGMNIAEEYLGPDLNQDRWVDVGLLIEGPSVKNLEAIFLRDWAYSTRPLFRKSASLPARAQSDPTYPLGDIQAQIISSGPDIKGDPLYDLLVSLIHRANETVRVVTPYFMPDETILKALEIASRRGVVVTILIPQHSNHRLADLARGSYVRQIRESGGKILYYPKMIHAKAVILDERVAILGSANFDMRSLLLNYELGIAVYSAPEIKIITEWFRSLSSITHSTSPPDYFLSSLIEGIARIFAPLI